MDEPPHDESTPVRETLRRVSRDLASWIRVESGAPELHVFWTGDDGMSEPALSVRLTAIGEGLPAEAVDQTRALALQGILEKLDASVTHGRHHATAAPLTLDQTYTIARGIVQAWRRAFDGIAHGDIARSESTCAYFSALSNVMAPSMFEPLLSPAECADSTVEHYIAALRERVLAEAVEKTRPDSSLPIDPEGERLAQEVLDASFDALGDAATSLNRVLRLAESDRASSTATARRRPR